MNVVASYAEEAFVNMGNVILDAFSIVPHSQPKTDVTSILSSLGLSDLILPEQKVSIQKRLLQAFPAIRIICDYETAATSKKEIGLSYNYRDVIKILTRFVSSIDCIRNQNLEAVDVTVVKYLHILLSAAPNTIRSIYKYDKNRNVPTLLPERGLAFFTKEKYLPKRQDRRLILNPKWPYSPEKILSDHNKTISEMGLVELISLFLEPNRVLDFINEEGVLYNLNFNLPPSKPCLSQKQIVHSLLSCYSIRIPKQIHNIKKGSLENSIEILQDLRKCPKDLFPVLPPNIQADFNLFDKSNRKIFMRRGSDRFAQLIIQYFDSNNCFEHLRFGIHLGFVSRKIHDKARYADGKERDRYAKDNINCFSTTNDAINFFSSLKKDFDVNEESFSYIRNGENFAMSIGDKTPQICDQLIKCQQPDFWISKYELEALAFYEYLCPRQAEHIIISEFEKAQNNVRQNPAKKKNVQRYVERLLNETEIYLDEIEDKISIIRRRSDSKIGCKRYKRVIANDLAAFLVKDIVFWMESEQKPSGLQYAVVKGMLFNFDGEQYNANDIEKALKEIHVDKRTHVILKSVGTPKSLLDLYVKYLECRKSFLSSKAGLNFLQNKLKDKSETLLQHHPIYLPRHIFINPIIDALKKESACNPRLEDVLSKIKTDKIYPLNYIVNSYFKVCCDDQSQSMYRCTRRDQYGFFRFIMANKEFIKGKDRDRYKNVFDRMNTENQRHNTKTVSNQAAFHENLKITKKHMISSEKAIRRHRTNDIILFLLAKKRLNESIQNFDLKLECISPNGTSFPNSPIIEQNLCTQIMGKTVTIKYLSSLREGYLIYRWLYNTELQQYIINKKGEQENVEISSKEIIELFNCQLRN